MEKLAGPKVRYGDGMHGGGYTAQDVKESNDLIAAGYMHIAIENLISEGHVRSGRSAKSFGMYDGTVTLQAAGIIPTLRKAGIEVETKQPAAKKGLSIAIRGNTATLFAWAKLSGGLRDQLQKSQSVVVEFNEDKKSMSTMNG